MMGPFRAVRSVIGNYFNFSGRAVRSEFWWWSLLQPLVIVAATFSDYQRLAYLDQTDPMALLSLSSTWVLLLTLIPNLSVAIRRLHDGGFSGMWYLLVLIPLVGSILLILFLLKPSQAADNKWGPNPCGDDQAWLEDYARAAAAAAGNATEITQMRREDVSGFYRQRVLGEPTA